MMPPGNCGAVAPLAYISKRKKVGDGTRENRVSGCSDRGFLGSKIPEKYDVTNEKYDAIRKLRGGGTLDIYI